MTFQPASPAYDAAWQDHAELERLTVLHRAAWQRHDLDEQIRCIRREQEITGRHPAQKARRADSYQRDYDNYIEEMSIGGTPFVEGERR